MRKDHPILTSLLVLLLLNLLVVFSGFSSSEHGHGSFVEGVAAVLDGAAEEVVEEEERFSTESLFSNRCILLIPPPIPGHTCCRCSLVDTASLALGWIVPLRI